MIRRIKACLNGPRRREEHPGLPVTAAELAEAAAGAVAAGAEAVHMHPRDHDGRESLEPGAVGGAVAAVRASCPGVPVGVSTGLWITGGDVARRRDLVARWRAMPAPERPDFASVNLNEPGWAELVEVLRTAGIAVEAGVWSATDAERLAGFDTAVARVLVEIADTPADDAVAAADGVLARLDRVDVRPPRLLHGQDAACWPLVAHAGRLGLPTRIGLEDTVVGPDGRPVDDNTALVRLALAMWSAAQA